MDVYQIWAQEAEFFWLVDAWDDDSIQANRSGYEAALKKAYDAHGAENIRVIRTVIDFGAVTKAFEVPTADSKTIGAER